MISATNAKVIFIFLFVYMRLIGALRLCDRTELLVSTCWTGLKVLALSSVDSPNPSTSVDHMLMFSIMWLAPVWNRALIWSWATPVKPSSVRETSCRRDETRTLRHGDATVTMDTYRDGGAADGPECGL